MGHCASSARDDAGAHSNLIDRQIEEDAKKYKRECKILLLGSGESGKSTIVKQMKIIHSNGYTSEDLFTFRLPIWNNLLQSAHAVVNALAKFNLEPITAINRTNCERILAYQLATDDPNFFSPDIAQAIQDLWADEIISALMTSHSTDFYLMDSATYFFEEANRIAASNYLPSTDDVLRARIKTTSITETRFPMGQLSVHMVDVGGQRSQRNKWIHSFESVTSVVFVTALSEYDQVLLEEKSQNRMAESLVLFESVINSRWFLHTSIILFLNKIDVFKNKLPKVPLDKYFPEYTGGADVNKGTKYILWRFMQVNRTQLSVYPHITQATDSYNIRLVFAAVKETIVRNGLKMARIL
ncbi:G-protein alpha subunit [Lactarius pseudohatsudake]|nr:G-protein alpha subunit [Lactarius pseudohatsudake]